MMFIDEIVATEVMDSRGNPTVKVTVSLSDGTVENAIVPSGASTGKREALELRDGGDRYMGKGVLQACENVNGAICDALVGLSPFNQAEIDLTMKEIDGTENYGNLGANAVTLTVNDQGAGSDNCTSTVTVLDTITPTAVCQNITVYLDGSGTATITAADVDGGSSDNCGAPNLAIDLSPEFLIIFSYSTIIPSACFCLIYSFLSSSILHQLGHPDDSSLIFIRNLTYSAKIVEDFFV